jgi:hypothetical protein
VARIDSVRPAPSTRPRSSLSSRWLAALDALPDGGVFDDSVSALPDDDLASLAWRGGARRGVRHLGDRRWGGAWMELRWPTLVRAPLPAAPLRLRLDGVLADSARSPWQRELSLAQGALVAATISDAIGADARRLRGARLARLTARTAVRVAAVEAVREQHGEVAGALAGLLVSAVDRADTRAWHTLPGALVVVRLTVPAGALHSALLQGEGANAPPLAWPALEPRPGSVHVLASRVWRDPEGYGGTRPVVSTLGGATR